MGGQMAAAAIMKTQKYVHFFLHDFTVQFSYVSHSHQGGNVRTAHGGETGICTLQTGPIRFFLEKTIRRDKKFSMPGCMASGLC